MISFERFVEALETAPVSTKNYVCINKPLSPSVPSSSVHRQNWHRNRLIKFVFVKRFLLWYLQVLSIIYYDIENHLNYFDWKLLEFYEVLKKNPFGKIKRICYDPCYEDPYYLDLQFVKKIVKCINSPYEIKPSLILMKTKLKENVRLSFPKRWNPMTLRQLCLPEVAKAK